MTQTNNTLKSGFIINKAPFTATYINLTRPHFFIECDGWEMGDISNGVVSINTDRVS